VCVFRVQRNGHANNDQCILLGYPVLLKRRASSISEQELLTSDQQPVSAWITLSEVSKKRITGREPGTSNEKPNWCIAAMAEGQLKTETVDPLVRLGAG
jgi:hypothetical protein